MNLTNAHVAHVSARTAPEIPVVYIVDSDASLRESLEEMVRFAGWRTRTAASAEEFLSLPRLSAPSCLLVELHLSGSSGLALQCAIADRSEMPVIFMSGRADVPDAVQAMKAGAFEFLTKPLVPNELVDSIGHAIERSHAALRQLSHEQALQQRYESLTCREREVMNLLIKGRLNKQVGGELGISEITVKAHRGKVMRKMRAGSFAELMNMTASLFRPRAMGARPS